jgi:hypothetical protein
MQGVFTPMVAGFTELYGMQEAVNVSGIDFQSCIGLSNTCAESRVMM